MTPSNPQLAAIKAALFVACLLPAGLLAGRRAVLRGSLGRGGAQGQRDGGGPGDATGTHRWNALGVASNSGMAGFLAQNSTMLRTLRSRLAGVTS